MAKNTGKDLREKNMSKFEDDPSLISASDSGTLDFSGGGEEDYSQYTGGFGNLSLEKQKQDAGRSFSQDGIVDSPFQEDHFNSKIFGIDLGPVMESQYESKSYNNVLNPEINFEKLKADNQSAFSKWGSLASQFTGKTLIGTVGNITGGIYGLGKWAFTEDGKVQDIIDNELYRTLDEANEAWEAKNTVFINPNEGLGFNFNTAKGITDAFSFISSMVISETLMNTVGNLAGGAGTASLPLRLARYSKQIGKIVKMLDKGEDLEKMALKLGKTVDEMSEIKRNIDLINKVGRSSTNFARRALTTTGYEASLSAREVKDQLMQNMAGELEYELARSGLSEEEKDRVRQERMAQIKDSADSASTMTFLMNTALLNVSNAMQFPQIFGTSFVKNKSVGSLVRKGLGEIGKKEGKRAATARMFGTVGRVLKNPATEFMEETLQGTIGKFAYNNYELMLGEGTQAGVLAPRANSIGDSMFKAVKDTYTTEEGLSEGIIGAFVGAVGIPGLKKHGKGKKFTMHGGVIGGFRENSAHNKALDDAISQLNSNSIKDAVTYKKDQAVRASVDSQREDLALMTGNKIEFEDVKNNKVYRYTVDRMEQGMEEYIGEDIKELKDIAENDIEKYRELFGKDESFDKEDAIEEVNDFERKVDIYKDAYKTVHKRFNANLVRQDKYTKKLTDLLTHAVATEKVYGKRLDNLKQRLVTLAKGDMTPEELDSFVKTSGKVSNAQDVLDKYLVKKTNEKKNAELSAYQEHRRKKIQEKINPAYRHYVYLDDAQIQQKLELNRTSNKSEKEKVRVEKEIKKVLKHKAEFSKIADQAKKFHKDKSYKAKNLEENLDEITQEINSAIEERFSKEMKEISRPPQKVTRKELEEYLKVRENVSKKLNKEFDSAGTLDMMKTDYALEEKELWNEINAITNKLTTATDVAAHLFGFKDNLGVAYAKVVGADMMANFRNATNLQMMLDFTMEDEPTDEFKALYEEFRDVVEDLEENLDDMAEVIKPESLEHFKELLQEFKDKLQEYRDFLGITEEMEEQRKKAAEKGNENEKNKRDKDSGKTDGKKKSDKKKDDSKEDGNEDPEEGDPLDFSSVSKDGDEDTVNENPQEDSSNPTDKTGQSSKGNKSTRRQVAYDETTNRYTIRENSKYAGQENKELKELLNNGAIKNDGAVVLRTDEANSLLPDDNIYLAKILKEHDGVDRTASYLEGYRKLQENPELLKASDYEALDKDVYTFIRFMPAKLDFYNKVLKSKDNYEFEIDPEKDELVHDSWMFVADDLYKIQERYAEAEKNYDARIENLDDQEEQAIKDLREMDPEDKNDTVSRIRSEYDKKRNDAYHALKATGNSSKSGFNFRYHLAYNHFLNNNSEFKLRVFNVDQGDFEHFNFEKKTVHEFSPETLDYKVENMTIDDIYYGNQQGKYVRIDGKKTYEMEEHPFKQMHRAVNGRIAFKYVNKAGKAVPITMNTGKLDDEHIKIMLKGLRQLFKSADKANFKTENMEPNFLNGKSKEEFMGFFMNELRGFGTSHLTFLKNTFKFYEPQDSKGEYHLYLNIGHRESVVIKNEEDLERKLPDILDFLKHNRFALSKKYIMKDGEINKEVLQYMFDKGIINHTFNGDGTNFDMIYKSGHNKGIVLSRHNTKREPQKYTTRKEHFGDALRNLREELGGDKKFREKHQVSVRAVNYSMIKSIHRSVRAQARELDTDRPSTDQIRDMIVKAVDNVTSDRIGKIMAVAKKFPGQYNKNGKHDTDFEIHPDDKFLDKYLRLIYTLRNDVYGNSNFIKQMVLEAQSYKSRNMIKDAFQKPPITNITYLNQFASKDKNNPKYGQVNTFIKTKKQFDSLMKMVKLLDRMTDTEKYIDIVYADDYKQSKKSSETWEYTKTPKNAAKKDLKRKHYKTRLTSIAIKGDPPRFEVTNPETGEGRIVGGTVLLNVRDWDYKNNKQKGGQVALIQPHDAEPNNYNIATAINFPFLDGNTFEVNDQEINHAIETIKIREEMWHDFEKTTIKNAKEAMGIDKNEDIHGGEADDSTTNESSYDEEEYTSENQDVDQSENQSDEELDDGTGLDFSSVSDPGTTTSPKKPNPSNSLNLTAYNDPLTKESLTESVEIYMEEIDSETDQKKLKDLHKEVKKEFEENFKIKDGETLVQIFDMYNNNKNDKGSAENEQKRNKIIKFAEQVYGSVDRSCIS